MAFLFSRIPGRLLRLGMRVFLALGFAFFAVSSNATLINYSESISGDISVSTAGPSFVIDMAGTHRWSGSTVFNSDPFLNDDEFFVISLGANLQITALDGSVSNANVAGYDRIDAQLAVFDPPGLGTTLFRETIDLLAATETIVTNLLPLGPGQYLVRAPSAGSSSCSGLATLCTSSWDWSISMTVSSSLALSESATLALFGLGALGLVAGSRRRKRR